MPIDLWKAAERDINHLFSLLDENRQFIISEDAEELLGEDHELVLANGEIFAIRGSLVSFVDRLDDEFIKSLQHIDPHTTEYVDRLKNETGLYAVIKRAQMYFEMCKLQESTCRVVMRRLEHLYYKVIPP